MVRIALRHILARRLRLLSSGVAVLLGVAFMAGTLVLTATVGQTFDDLFSDVSAGVDAYVRAEAEVEGDFVSQRARLDEALLGEVRQVDGVRAAFPEVDGYAQIVGSDGEPIGNPSQGPPTFGTNWVPDEGLNPFEIAEGRPPAGPGEVVIDRQSAKTGDLQVGDRTTVLTKSPPATVTVVGIATFGSADSPGGASFAMFDTPTAQALLAEPGKVDAIAAAAEDGVSERELVNRVEEVVPPGVEVLTGEEITEENQDDIADAIGFFEVFMLTFAAIALFVGGFIIFNTFSILVAQRTRELALLRAVGASRSQVIVNVLLEATVVGLLASVVGLAAGLGVAAGLKALLAGFGVDIPAAGLTVEPSSMVLAASIGFVLTVVSATVPALRASRVPPLAAIREVDVDTSHIGLRRIVAGLAVLALGLAALLAGLFGGGSGAPGLVGLGAAITFVAANVLGPVAVRPVARAVGAPLVRFRGIVGRLARENAVRNPRRTAATATALTIGVGLVAFITIFASSAKASINALVDRTFTGDFVIEPPSEGFGGVSPALADRLQELPEVEVAAGLRVAPVEALGDQRIVFGVDADRIVQVLDLDVTAGSVEDLGAGEIAVHADRAEADELEVGEEVVMRFADTGERRLRVAAVYESDLLQQWFVDLATFEEAVADQIDSAVFVIVADGVPLDRARTAIEGVTSDFPTADVQDLTEFKQAQADQINQILGLIYVLLALAIFIALVGIANTLALSVLERTRELGLLRAVGTTRRQLRSAVRWEAILVALFGTAVGILIGLVFGGSLVASLADEGIDRLDVPVGQLAVIVVVAGLAGVGASMLPARRAARLDVLAAIYDE